MIKCRFCRKEVTEDNCLVYQYNSSLIELMDVCDNCLDAYLYDVDNYINNLQGREK